MFKYTKEGGKRKQQRRRRRRRRRRRQWWWLLRRSGPLCALIRVCLSIGIVLQYVTHIESTLEYKSVHYLQFNMGKRECDWDAWALQSWITKKDRQHAKLTGRKRGALKTALLKVLLRVHAGVDPLNMSFRDNDMQFVVTRYRELLAAMHWSLHGRSEHDSLQTSHIFEYPQPESLLS